VKINWAIAWNATHNLVISIGVIALFCFIVTLKPFFLVTALLFLAGLWYVLYRLELGYRTRRLRDFRY
jgi:hypothetical protein